VTSGEEIMKPFAENRFEKGILAAPDRILVATDLTDGDYLLPHVIEQARASNAHVTLVHSILPANLLPMEGGALTYAEQEKIDDVVRSILTAMAAKIQEQGITCSTVAEHGFAVDVILAQIESTRANRLILGTHGRGRLAHMALGSVASDLLSRVKIPTLTVGPHARNAANHTVPQNILHPVSLQRDYRRVAAFAMDLSQSCRADLTLLHVVDPGAGDSGELKKLAISAAAALTELAPNGENLVPPVHTSVTYGNTVEEILYAASKIDADWIVLGVEETSSRWPFGESIAYKVLATANCPVLTFRHQAQAVKPQSAMDTCLAATLP
jgi:nucleotide-binding universal stress UspA family protein